MNDDDKAVRQCQLFRYPGGKTKFLKNAVFTQALHNTLDDYPVFYEGFAGSAAASIYLAQHYPGLHIVLNDLSPEMAAFWTLVAKGTKDELAEFLNLLKQPVTIELFNERREGKYISTPDLAYNAVFFNRTTFSGIAHGSPIGGKSQDSKYLVGCRYNAKTLKTRFTAVCQLLRGRLTVTNLPILQWLDTVPTDAPMYLDPPYIEQGDALYAIRMRLDEHTSMAAQLKQRSNWLLSYDFCEQVGRLYGWASRQEVPIRYTVTSESSFRKGGAGMRTEYLITNNARKDLTDFSNVGILSKSSEKENTL